MNVKVTTFLSGPASEKSIDSLKTATAELTNAKRSVRVGEQPDGDNYALVTTSTMKTAAQYKIVDAIYKAFKSRAWAIEGYQDISIQFP